MRVKTRSRWLGAVSTISHHSSVCARLLVGVVVSTLIFMLLAADAGATPKKVVDCTDVSGSVAAVTISGCTPVLQVGSGGTGTLAFTTSPDLPAPIVGGTTTITFGNGATATVTYTVRALSGRHWNGICGPAPMWFPAYRIRGVVTSQGSLPTGDPGVKPHLRAILCETPGGASVILESGTLSI